MNKIHSPEMERELNEKRAAHLEYVNKDLNKTQFDKSPGEVSTVHLYPNSDNPHMRTAWEYQIAFENGPV